MRCNGAEIIVRLLERQDVRMVTGIPGGSNLPLYHVLARSSIRHILARHEQGAGFIAQGMARTTGKAAVCLATSGPGVTNLLTAIADAKLDSVPLVAITGQVPSHMIGTDAFQEVDTYGITMHMTKHNFLVKRPAELLDVIPRAFRIAESGRPGPVVIDVPKDVQLATIDFAAFPHPLPPEPPRQVNSRVVGRIAGLISRARRPVIYAGGGIVSSGAEAALHALARRGAIPVALTLRGLGSFPPDDPLYLGMLGMHGAASTNFVLDESDLLLAFGVRFDDRAIGKMEEFCPRATIVHVDIDPSEIHKVRRAHVPLVADIRPVLEMLLPLVEPAERRDWMARVDTLNRAHPLPPSPSDDPLHPLAVIDDVARESAPDTIVTTDVGQHQMWVAQRFPFHSPRTLLTSSGLGTMGFGLPAAIGASLANPGRRVICFSGDGSLQMNIQELATLAELDLPVTVIVMNNQHLGLVRQQQELFFDQTYIASRFHARLDFAAIARAFGISSVALGTDEPEEAIRKALRQQGPNLVDVPIHHTANVFPMVPPGAPNRDMIMEAG